MIAGDAVLLVYLECAAADVEKREAEIGQALGVEVTWTRRDGGSRG
ncbi:MAG: hypothetical protein Q4G50_01495 [Corynebacterium sp.]|nr:hypothetical protein [Corynebacterium sp.]MDO5668654.1 hypothetical protein [Corynebacterium sp.]